MSRRASCSLAYGYGHNEVPVYFSSGPVLNAGAGAMPVASRDTSAGRGGRAGSVAQNTTPMATPLKLSAWDPDKTGTAFGLAKSIGNDFNVAQAGQAAGGGGGRGGAGGGGGGGGGAGGFGGGGGGGPPTVAGLTAD